MIDGASHGTVSELDARGGLVQLAPGTYRVTIKAPGFETWRAEVAVENRTDTIALELTPRPQ